jgi:hypothetical protein
MKGMSAISSGVALAFVAAIALAEGRQGVTVEPAAQLAVVTPGAATRSSASILPEHLQSWIPRMEIPIIARVPGKVAPVKEPVSAEALPPVYSAALAAPARVQFEQGARILVTPAPELMPRIPNLLPTNRRAVRQSPNSTILPAAPVSTPPVCNLDGTPDLPRLRPFAREIQIEIAPLPAMLPFDQAPYLQSAVAPDDADVPASLDLGAPGRVVLK